MVGIILITHGALGEALTECATHVMGQPPTGLAHVVVAGGSDPDALLRQTAKLIAALDDGSGVLLVTDMVGGTPANVATRALVPGRVEGVSGASLPMLIRALTYRNDPLATVVAKALSGGKDGVVQLLAGAPAHASSRS